MGSSLSLCCKSTEEGVVDEDYAESGIFQDDSGSGHEDTNADNGTVADVEGQTAGQKRLCWNRAGSKSRGILQLTYRHTYFTKAI